jgi:hypothetical protein
LLLLDLESRVKVVDRELAKLEAESIDLHEAIGNMKHSWLVPSQIKHSRITKGEFWILRAYRYEPKGRVKLVVSPPNSNKLENYWDDGCWIIDRG